MGLGQVASGRGPLRAAHAMTLGVNVAMRELG